jgi:hypothetical protein
LGATAVAEHVELGAVPLLCQFGQTAITLNSVEFAKLVINLKTAKALGLTLPATLLSTAKRAG